MIKELLYSEDKLDHGLLLLRVGIGVAFMLHGFPKLFMGGAPHLAKGLAATGIPGGVIGAYLAGAAEFFGGIALILGILVRPAAIIMAFNMLVAVIFHLIKGDSWMEYSHPVEAGILFLSFIVMGPGKFSLDREFWGRKKEVKKSTSQTKAAKGIGDLGLDKAA